MRDGGLGCNAGAHDRACASCGVKQLHHDQGGGCGVVADGPVSDSEPYEA